MPPRVKIIQDNTSKVINNLLALTGKSILVGIPSNEAERNDEINNATLGYIHEFGAPKSNIPARPFLLPGVEKAKTDIIPLLEKASKFALSDQPSKRDQALAAAGMVASDKVRAEFHQNSWVPLKPETVANRYRQRGDTTQRKSEQLYAHLISQGKSPAEAQAQANIRPLINTGQLLNSITYVVRKRPK